MIPPDTCLMIGMDGMGYTPRKNIFRSLDFFYLYFFTHRFVRFSGMLRVTTLSMFRFMLLVRFLERCTYGAARRIYVVWTGVG